MPSIKILVADDDHDILDLLTAALKSQDYDVKSVSDGTQAEIELKKGTFDLLILDIMLPGDSGLKVSTFASSLHHPPKILTISARRNITEGQLAWAGVDLHIDKPFEVDEFLKQVKNLLELE